MLAVECQTLLEEDVISLMVRSQNELGCPSRLSSLCTLLDSMLLRYLLVLRFHETAESINVVWHDIIRLLVNLNLVDSVCIIRSECPIKVVRLHDMLLCPILVIPSGVRDRLRFPVPICSGIKLFDSMNAIALDKVKWCCRLVIIRIVIG